MRHHSDNNQDLLRKRAKEKLIKMCRVKTSTTLAWLYRYIYTHRPPGEQHGEIDRRIVFMAGTGRLELSRPPAPFSRIVLEAEGKESGARFPRQDISPPPTTTPSLRDIQDTKTQIDAVWRKFA